MTITTPTISAILLKVVALPPEEEPFYEYGGNPGEEDRRRFYVLKEPCCREPVERSELFVHALVFRKIALNIARSCGKTEREISGTELIPECLIRLFDFPVTAYFAFAFDERLGFQMPARHPAGTAGKALSSLGDGEALADCRHGGCNC